MNPWAWTFWRIGWTHRRDTATWLDDGRRWDRVCLGLYWRRPEGGKERDR